MIARTIAYQGGRLERIQLNHREEYLERLNSGFDSPEQHRILAMRYYGLHPESPRHCKAWELAEGWGHAMGPQSIDEYLGDLVELLETRKEHVGANGGAKGGGKCF